MNTEKLYSRYIKALLDRLLAFLGLILLSWLLLLIALGIYIDNPGPVIYTQRRIGQNKKGSVSYFKIYKFRTMFCGTPELPTHLLENPAAHLTRLGKILRAYGLDELPQLFNIAFPHNLSFVGPRPGLWSQEELYREREKYGANDVLPGLTGLAQVSGRDELSTEEKAALDGEYARNISFALDLKCIFRTFAVVFSKKGYREGAAEAGEDRET